MSAAQLAHLPEPDYSTHDLPLASWEYDVLSALYVLREFPITHPRHWAACVGLSRNARRIYDQLVMIQEARP